jgi:xanthine dehydrogenase small subunit
MAAVRFLLNGVPRAAESLSPTTTVLDWLRGTARLTGTKEGCAEGDCGACTIAVSRAGGRYQAVNSCLMVMPQLDGCAVLTIEAVAAGEALHPVQQAMLDADATQCGFCTPGFVMSMFALQQDGGVADDETIHAALAGNLCRCTGYRAIVDACRAAAPVLPADPGRGALKAPRPATEFRAEGQIFFAPRTIENLLALRARHPDAVLLAGGTDLGLRVSKDRVRWPLTISTANVSALREIKVSAGDINVGAAATYSDLLPHLDRHIPAFAALVRRIGSRQIRNLGTLAGNVATASPIGDTLPCLIALDATVRLRSQAGARTLSVADFITGYRQTALAADEIIERITIPLPGPDTCFAAYKLSKRFDQDISTVVASFHLEADGNRVRALRAVFGGMGPRMLRAGALERAAVGRDWRADDFADLDALIAEDFQPLSDQRGSAPYRLRAAAGLVRRFQLEIRASTVPLRLEAL